jgi:GT2 family glycosyltransferase
MKLISIIVLNYNEPQITVRCLGSLKDLMYKNYEIILVDNGSVEDIEKYVKSSEQIKIIKNKKNLGYAEGNNVGVKIAKGDLIVFLNNDVVVEKDFLNPLVEKLLSDPQIAAVQPKILQYPKKQLVDSVGSYFMSTGFLYHVGHNKKDQKKYQKEAEIFTMKGACMIFKKKVLDKVGILDKDYFAYFEETDLCQRVLLAGYKIVYTPTSVIYHEGGQTSKKLQSTFVQFHSYKNRIYTYCKNLEAPTLLKVLPLHLLLCEVVSALYLVTGKFSLAWSIQRAILWNMGRIGKIKQERKKIKKLRKLRDNEYLPKVTRTVRPSYYYHLFTTALAGYND